VDQINGAIDQMEQATRNSAAQAEQGAASASELNTQAVAMSDVVFRLKTLVEGKAAA
jgi:methyl-accepting chemotaxis protein